MNREVHYETSQTFNIERFAKIANGLETNTN